MTKRYEWHTREKLIHYLLGGWTSWCWLAEWYMGNMTEVFYLFCMWSFDKRVLCGKMCGNLLWEDDAYREEFWRTVWRSVLLFFVRIEVHEKKDLGHNEVRSWLAWKKWLEDGMGFASKKESLLVWEIAVEPVLLRLLNYNWKTEIELRLLRTLPPKKIASELWQKSKNYLRVWDLTDTWNWSDGGWWPLPL